MVRGPIGSGDYFDMNKGILVNFRFPSIDGKTIEYIVNLGCIVADQPDKDQRAALPPESFKRSIT